MTTWLLPTVPEFRPRSYNEMTDEGRLDAADELDRVYTRLCETRDIYLKAVRAGVLIEDPLVRANLQSVCELVNRDMERICAARGERARWAALEKAAG